VPKSSIKEVFKAVETGGADCGIVPIENSIEGAIGQTLDLLAETSLEISGEVMLNVRLCLMNISGKIDDVKMILSHSQPLGQARAWLDRHHMDSTIVPSTSAAAEMSSKESDKAAIASSLAAEEYGLKIIPVDGGIEDNPNNITRFFIISNDRPAPTGNDKTSLLFSVKDESGALFKILKPFSDGGINLTKIESRPSRKKAWEYLFFVDLLGHYGDPKVRAAVDELEKSCVFLKVLGSYPVALEG
jgi:chorismate mutase/prephenate dehydratase